VCSRRAARARWRGRTRPENALQRGAEASGGGARGPVGCLATLPGVDSLGRTLIIAGVILIVLGLLLYAGPAIPLLGKLPGDLRIERPGFRVYIPITSCLLVSLLVSGVLWILARMR